MHALLISPHLDDAVFGCGEWLQAHPGTRVVTVFAGNPAHDTPLTDWDARCGFEATRDVVAARRAEDRAALAVLGAEPLWLDFLDSQYGASPCVEDVATAIGELLDWQHADAPFLFPLGLFHSDHALVHDACLVAWRRRPRPAQLYEDALYRGAPGLLQRRLAALQQQGVELTPVKEPRASDAAVAAKARAVQCYESQLRAFGAGGYDDLSRPERRWRLARTDDPATSQGAGDAADA